MTKANESRHVTTLHKNAEKALKKAVEKAITKHELAGVPAVVWRDGKVVRLPIKRK